MTEFIHAGGGRLWSTRQGVGLPVLLCNGGPGCCDYLGPVAAMMGGLASIIRFEGRGCGRSDPAPLYNLESAVGDLEAVPAGSSVGTRGVLTWRWLTR